MRRVSAVLVCSLALAASGVLAEPDLSAPEAFAAASEGKIQLIDIRTPQEWRQTGVAPGAGRIDFYRGPEILLDSILRMVNGNKGAPIALICRTGNRTAHAQKFLQAQGFTRVYNVKEGMAGSAAGPGWLKRNLPVNDCRQC